MLCPYGRRGTSDIGLRTSDDVEGSQQRGTDRRAVPLGCQQPRGAGDVDEHEHQEGAMPADESADGAGVDTEERDAEQHSGGRRQKPRDNEAGEDGQRRQERRVTHGVRRGNSRARPTWA